MFIYLPVRDLVVPRSLGSAFVAARTSRSRSASGYGTVSLCSLVRRERRPEYRTVNKAVRLTNYTVTHTTSATQVSEPAHPHARRRRLMCKDQREWCTLARRSRSSLDGRHATPGLSAHPRLTLSAHAQAQSSHSRRDTSAYHRAQPAAPRPQRPREWSAEVRRTCAELADESE